MQITNTNLGTHSFFSLTGAGAASKASGNNALTEDFTPGITGAIPVPTETVTLSQTGKDLANSPSYATQPNVAPVPTSNSENQTAEQIDAMQKSSGLLNTMAALSPAEKALYDKAVASGDTAAAAGIGNIAFLRAAGNLGGRADGSNYNPSATAITVANIEQDFSQSIVDPTGKTESQFQALIRFLQNNPA
jgi:hypothetical protein